MIRLLNKDDCNVVSNFLHIEHYKNLYLLANISIYGYDNEFQKIWGEFDDYGKLIAILLKNNKFFLFYSNGDFSTEAFSDILIAENFNTLGGCTFTLDKFKEYIEFSEVDNLYLSVLNKYNNNISYNTNTTIKELKVGDGSKVVYLANQIYEFGTIPYEADKLDDAFSTKKRKGCYISDDDGNIISMAHIGLDSDNSCMIIGVATHPDYRNNGYASLCVSKLCSDALSKNKTVALCYDNPTAGKIYHNLGFEDVCDWSFFSR